MSLLYNYLNDTINKTQEYKDLLLSDFPDEDLIFLCNQTIELCDAIKKVNIIQRLNDDYINLFQKEISQILYQLKISGHGDGDIPYLVNYAKKRGSEIVISSLFKNIDKSLDNLYKTKKQVEYFKEIEKLGFFFN